MTVVDGIRPEVAGTLNNFPTLEINILDPQAQRLHQTKTRAIKQRAELCHQPLQSGKQACHLAIQKQQCRQRLLERGWRHALPPATTRTQ